MRIAIAVVSLWPVGALAADLDGDGCEDAWAGACVHPSASVAPSATVGAGASVGAGAVVGPEIDLGAGAAVAPRATLAGRVAAPERLTVGAGAAVGRRASVGADALIGEGASLARAVSAGPGLDAGDLAAVGYAATFGARVFLGDGAVVGNLATLGDDARVEGLARVGRGADLGAGAVLRAGAAVGPDVQLGAGAEIGAEAKVRRGANIGAGARVAAQASVGRGAQIGAGAAVAIGAVVRAGGVVSTCADLGAGDVVGRGETFSEGWACALPGEDPASALASCKAIRDGWPAGQPAPTTRDYFIDPDGGDSANAYAVRCEMDTDQGGWTLVGSFVNTDGVVRWSRPAGYSAFQDTGTFGTLAGAATSDFKSAAWSQVGATDLLVTDAYGWVSYDAVLGGGTMRGLMSSVSTCQTAPLVPPGDPRVDASHATLRTGAMLALFAGDPNSSQNCGFSGVHSDSATLALSGAGCGAMGAGQWGTNYNSGMDWHMTFNAPDLCIACDGCGNWNGYAAVTSATHNNNAGAHDNSTWAMVWVR